MELNLYNWMIRITLERQHEGLSVGVARCYKCTKELRFKIRILFDRRCVGGVVDTSFRVDKLYCNQYY